MQVLYPKGAISSESLPILDSSGCASQSNIHMNKWRKFNRMASTTAETQHLGYRIIMAIAIHPDAYLRDENNLYVLVDIPRVLEQPVSDLKAGKRAP